jgi:fucokinase
MSSADSTLSSLHVALDANAAAYRRMVQTSAPGDCWDVLVLTAANEKQAQGYRQELALRHRTTGPGGAFFPAIQKSIVVPDPPGRRAGSGGATLGVLEALQRELAISTDELSRLRILLIHSGGASQRLPAYSPLGKIFAPLPLLRPDGNIATLFDHLYLTLAGLPDRLGPGMLVLAGDVFLLFDHRHVSAPKPGVTAISMRVEADLGRGHGVFVTSDDGRISKTLQKVSIDAMKAAGADDERGNILIDTGLLFFDPPSLAKLGALAGLKSARQKQPAGLHVRHPQQIDLYEDMTSALAAGTQRKDYLAVGAARAMREELWRSLHGVAFRVMEVQGQFLHLGTTLQFRDAMVGRNPSPAAELFQQNVLTSSQWQLAAGRRVYHSSLLASGGDSGEVGERSVIEHSILGGGCRIGRGCVVSQVVAVKQALRLGDNLLFFQAPVRAKDQTLYVQVLCGAEDDFKGSFVDGACRYLNQPIDRWLKRHRISPEVIWKGVPADKRTLWTAMLFPATVQRDAAGSLTWITAQRPATAASLRKWQTGPRYSMAMILESADPAGLIEHREIVAAHLQATEVIDSIRRRESRPLEDIIGHHSSSAAYDAAIGILRNFAAEQPVSPAMALDQARAQWTIAQLLGRGDHPQGSSARALVDAQQRAAFARVASASELGDRPLLGRAEPAIIALKPGVLIEAAAPIRIDLTGGWSDTPPYCFEEGGHVVNVALDLDGRAPVRATVRTLREPVMVLESADLGRRIEIPQGEFASQKPDVHDPFALHRIALEMVGLTAARGAGVHLLTECRVPKGSGLGTSSILSATLLAALHKLRGQQPTNDELIQQTLLLEQRLSTGGGWQDQVGGIIGGVKSTVTAPGIPQQPVVEQLALSDSTYQALDERLVVYYSGQQRLARDILRRVEGRWLAREPAAVLLKAELKESAAALRDALLKGQWKLVAREIARYWRIKKDLFPGSTTPATDVLLLELREHYLAAGLAGAGGGGFAYFFCQDARQAQTLRELLAERSSRPGFPGNVYQTQINRTGLTVTRRQARGS